ncbi:rab11 family-interacting protein 2-like protein [Lates japonicus]|uniref:Rab11 family-interacting protein 2-like protein n=1 Tax=Lates japonicus TaxID=270547 RepID=A0AAD3MJI7_LATJO|nr:rab11 family-interacting protein 2-like protein [Lates japonicus]
MSLADQQWCPTSVQVTVLQARGLRIKGKSGTNDAYAVMQVGKEKYQTSVVEKTVAPVWKEEASFDLPPLHQTGGGGGERGTLHVCVSHRALVGPDKQLGQAVVNLLQLSEDKSRNKTEWFKLLDKNGKADKDRGEVLLDIQFMRNNMTASMFDLSAAGKSRSRLGKFKDKVRGKKKESDTASSVVPSITQVLTDSEEEAAANGDGELAAGKDEKKKKHKIKSLFSPKSNLQKNMSQSMSVLPVKNSSLSGSQSSGLNVDSSEGKKKFKFKIHKRSGSDSKDSSSGHQKHGSVEQSNLCINGSHVYCEEPPPRTSRIGSNFSLASSGHGSMEDVPESSPPSVDSLRAEIPNSAAELESSTTKVSDVQQGSAVSSAGGKTISTDEKDLISAQREKRPAPQPPGRSQAESRGEQDVSTRHLAQINKQGNDKDVKTDSVLPQCSVKMIAPLSQPLTDTKNTQSLEQTSTTKGAASARLHSKRPAPSRPRSVEESSEPKTALSSNDNISQRDDTAQKTSLKEPPKLARAQSTGEEASVKKEVPPVPSRRLQPVKPLNPQEQQSVSIVQGGKDNKSTRIPGEVQEKTKVNDTGLKGPYSQLTREELISLVLKQENQLSERDKKISELEQYIDNLLVRVMEEQPSILMSMSCLKKAV